MSVLDNTASVDTLAQDVRKTFGVLGTELISSKLAERAILQESIANGGPSSAHDAVINLMDYLKVGIRELASATGVKRHKLNRMIQGDENMPPEVLSKIHEVFQQRKPELFGNVQTTSSKARM